MLSHCARIKCEHKVEDNRTESEEFEISDIAIHLVIYGWFGAAAAAVGDGC